MCSTLALYTQNLSAPCRTNLVYLMSGLGAVHVPQSSSLSMAAPPPSEPLGASTLGKADLSKTYKCFMLHECRM